MGKELEKVKEEKVTLKLGGKEREIKYGFSAWAKIEEEYGGIDNIEQLMSDVEKKPLQTIPHLIWIGLKDKEGLNEETVLDDYSLADVQYITEVFQKALNISLPDDDGKKGEMEA